MNVLIGVFAGLSMLAYWIACHGNDKMYPWEAARASVAILLASMLFAFAVTLTLGALGV